jgi:hypothetical protein
MRSIVSAVLICTVIAYAGDTKNDIDLTPIKAFSLSLDHWHSLTGERMKQTIDVSEGESFRVVTTVNGTRWTTKGVVGQVKGDTVSVELTTEWFKSEKSNQRSKTHFNLKLMGEKARGFGSFTSTHGVTITPSIKRNKLR